jgi:energy-coupling factor transporter ATP-binding protein EcfA2
MIYPPMPLCREEAMLATEPHCLARLALHERLAYVETIRIWYPRLTHLFEAIQAGHELNRYSAEPQCLMVVGPTGVGKSTLLNSYAAQYPREILAETTRMPVLKVTVPAKATIRNFITRLLVGVGDPLADRGTVGSLELRLLGLLRDSGVEVLMVDDLQHFVDRDSERVLHDVSNWLKNLVKETHIACVIAGLPEAEQVLSANPQLGRLFGDPHILHPFVWEPEQPQTIQEFRTFLQTLEGLLPLPEASHLAGMETAWRCFVASDGCMAYLMNLIRRATQAAVQRDQPRLNLALLAEAFDHRLAGTRRGIPNPFVGDIPARSVEKPPIPARRATNRRSKRL